MKKTISIIVVALIFLASLIANVYYVFDGDPSTNPNFTEVIEKGKDVYDAIKSEAPAADLDDVSPAPEPTAENSALVPSYESWTHATATVIRTEHRLSVLAPTAFTREGA